MAESKTGAEPQAVDIIIPVYDQRGDALSASLHATILPRLHHLRRG
jgi:hypothetical protein